MQRLLRGAGAQKAGGECGRQETQRGSMDDHGLPHMFWVAYCSIWETVEIALEFIS